MRIENQILNIKQVRELQELGFDIEKHSSMYYIPNWNIKFGVDNYLLQIGGLGEDYDGDCIPTLTIGDIIEILPEEIIVKDEDCNFFTYEFNIIKNSIYYYEFDINDDLYYSGINKTFIDALFETLKWCIKEKHINYIERK